MKLKITPTEHEVRMEDDEFIVSKTDPKGIITYVNRTFMKISGFTEPELLHKQHNIIRHPDMPRGAFRLMWQTLEKGEEFFAYVKNIRKDGGYYWVLANVTPDYDSQGILRGYYSVRRQPSRKAIETIMPIYRQMLEVERKSGPKNAPDDSIAYLLKLLEQHQTNYQDFILNLDR